MGKRTEEARLDVISPKGIEGELYGEVYCYMKREFR